MYLKYKLKATASKEPRKIEVYYKELVTHADTANTPKEYQWGLAVKRARALKSSGFNKEKKVFYFTTDNHEVTAKWIEGKMNDVFYNVSKKNEACYTQLLLMLTNKKIRKQQKEKS